MRPIRHRTLADVGRILPPHQLFELYEGINMFYVYLLRSKKDDDCYIGFTNSLERRIQEHNNGLVASTSLRKPFELIYSEWYKSEKDARHRETNLKLRSRAFAQLKKRIYNSLLQ